MMTNCFFALSGFGPGWTFTLTLIAAAVAATYLLTKRSNETSEGISQ